MTQFFSVIESETPNFQYIDKKTFDPIELNNITIILQSIITKIDVT